MIDEKPGLTLAPRTRLAQELAARKGALSASALMRRLDLPYDTAIRLLRGDDRFGAAVGRKVVAAFPELRALVAECLLDDEAPARRADGVAGG